MVFNLLAAIAVTCADGGDFAHTISRPPGGMLGDCGLSIEETPVVRRVRAVRGALSAAH